MKHWRHAALLLCAGVLAGCASNNSQKFMSEQASYALKVVRAAGMRDIQDHVVPQAEYVQISETAIYKAGWAGISYAAPAPGISPNAAFAIGALGFLFGPDADSSRDAVIAWMPESMAGTQDDAAVLMRDLVHEAIAKTAAAMGMTITETHTVDRSEYQNGSIALEDPQGRCEVSKHSPTVPTCFTFASIRRPEKKLTPAFIDEAEAPAHAFTIRSPRYSIVELNHSNPQLLSNRAFLLELSQYLPNWAFIYSAPVGTNTAERKKSFPVLFSQGKTHLFVIPKES